MQSPKSPCLSTLTTDLPPTSTCNCEVWYSLKCKKAGPRMRRWAIVNITQEGKGFVNCIFYFAKLVVMSTVQNLKHTTFPSEFLFSLLSGPGTWKCLLFSFPMFCRCVGFKDGCLSQQLSWQYPFLLQKKQLNVALPEGQCLVHELDKATSRQSVWCLISLRCSPWISLLFTSSKVKLSISSPDASRTLMMFG